MLGAQRKTANPLGLAVSLYLLVAGSLLPNYALLVPMSKSAASCGCSTIR